MLTERGRPVAVPHYCTDFFPSSDIMQLVILVVFLQDYNFQRAITLQEKKRQNKVGAIPVPKDGNKVKFQNAIQLFQVLIRLIFLQREHVYCFK